jgi:16S rRNA processing protein RimM
MNCIPPAVHVIGTITSKHGFKGTIHIKWDDEDLIPSEGDFLFVLIDQKGVPFRILNMNSTAELVDLECIDHEEKTKDLIGKSVGLDMAQIPENTHHTALDTYELIDANSAFKGIIEEVSEYPGQLMLHVRCDNRNYLIPYVEDWIIETQINTRTLVMKLPNGLIEDVGND